MPSKYNEAISKIKIDEKKKEEIIKRLKENSTSSKRGTIMFKVRKTLTTIAAIAGIAVCGGAAYAGISGKLNLFNNRIDTEYENYVQEIQEKYVEDKQVKISLNEVACDDAYLILNYTIDVKEAGKEKFNEIKFDDTTGFELNLDTDIALENKKFENISNFSHKVAKKITDVKAEIYEIVDITDKNLPDKFNLKISNFRWYGDNQTYSMKDVIRDTLSIEVNKKEANKKTVIDAPVINKYMYKDLKLKVEKIVKTPFETFMIITTEEKNVSSDRFSGGRDEEMIDLDLEIYDENDQKLKVDKKSIERLRYEDGTYYRDLLNYSSPGGNFKNAKIYKKYIIALGDKIENVKSLTIKPLYLKFADNGVNEEKYISSLKWYDVKNEKHIISQGTGESVQINKVEIKEDRILFYYTLSNSNIEPKFYIRNKERAFNYFWADIENTKTPSGEYVTGIRIKGYEGSSMYNFEKGDNHQNADPEKYSDEAFLSDPSKLIYTVDLEEMYEKEYLGYGITFNIEDEWRNEIKDE